MGKLCVAVILLPLLLAACAHQAGKPPIRLPDTAEIEGYVSARWAAEFNSRFNRFSGRPAQSSVFASVQNAYCRLAWGGTVAECSYDVSSRFGGDENVTLKLSSSFQRDGNGSLNEVLIIWHERER